MIRYAMIALALSALAAGCSEKGGPEEPSAFTVGFELAPLGAAGYLNDDSYTEHGLTLRNRYYAEWGGWAGFAFSSLTDRTTQGPGNQYSVYASSGAGGSARFAVGYYEDYTASAATMAFDAGSRHTVQSVMVCNAAYTALSVLHGDDFSRRFEAGDWLTLTATGYDAAGARCGSETFYLADFRDGRNYVCSEWTQWDLSGLGAVNRIDFTLASSDTSPQTGMNTPAYFCLDDIVFR